MGYSDPFITWSSQSGEDEPFLSFVSIPNITFKSPSVHLWYTKYTNLHIHLAEKETQNKTWHSAWGCRT